MKRSWFAFVLFLASILLLSGCGSNGDKAAKSDKRASVGTAQTGSYIPRAQGSSAKRTSRETVKATKKQPTAKPTPKATSEVDPDHVSRGGFR